MKNFGTDTQRPHRPNQALLRTSLARRRRGLTCRAWRVTCGVRVPTPGEGEAEGKRKGNCVAARRGGEAVQLRKRGVSRDLAWNTSKSAHGPWRISMSPALDIALPTRHFVEMGWQKSHKKIFGGDMKKSLYLDEEEKDLEEALNRGEWRSVKT